MIVGGIIQWIPTNYWKCAAVWIRLIRNYDFIHGHLCLVNNNLVSLWQRHNVDGQRNVREWLSVGWWVDGWAGLLTAIAILGVLWKVLFFASKTSHYFLLGYYDWPRHQSINKQMSFLCQRFFYVYVVSFLMFHKLFCLTERIGKLCSLKSL